MKKNKLNIVLALLVLSVLFEGCKPKVTEVKLGINSSKEVIAAMTLQEKAMLLVGSDTGFPRGYPSFFGGADSLFATQPPAAGNTKKLVPGAAGTTYPIPRLGIPAIVLADGPAGVRIDPFREDSTKTYYTTTFPIESLLACSWDKELVNEVGRCMGKEALEYGVDVLLAPALNIHRNPLGGRNFEYYSEDPVISGEIAAAMVNGVQSMGVGTSLKHFAANNNETNRMNIDVKVDSKTLHEMYLKGFEIAVIKSNPWTIMSAYNKINKTYCSENPYLLDSVLRKEWGFKGLVMTDWFAGRNRIQQVRAGNDLLMPGSTYIIDLIINAVESGELDEAYLDRNVERILNLIKKTPRFKQYQYSDQPDLKEHAQVARRAAAESMVLLKNEDVLPLKHNNSKIAAFGIGTYQTIAVGTGSGNVNSEYTTTIYSGLNAAGYQLSDELRSAYQQYILDEKARVGEKASYFDPDIMLKEKNWDEKELLNLAKETEIALFTIGRTSGEFADRKIKDDFELTKEEVEMITKLSKVFHSQGKKLIVLLNIGGVIETASWKHLADAILLAWQPGMEGGNAVADLISGKVNPSGKLTMTFPFHYVDVPSSEFFPSSEQTPERVEYLEGEEVGYRYYNAENVTPSFSFGFGLSYTQFVYKELGVQPLDKFSYKLNLRVKNTGKYSGKEIVQVYVKTPQNSFVQLKQFTKTALIKPGDEEVIEFNMDTNDWVSYNAETNQWEAPTGDYEILIGASSDDIRLKRMIQLPMAVLLTK
nr:beta-glucosidase [uncultured Carboxylicivirga sp.]